ncbi:MAG: adenine phosphoribosyltransferase [bacterium]
MAPSVSAPNAVAALIARRLRDVPDFPQPGVLFKDITPLLADGDAFAVVLEALADVARAKGPLDLVAGVEARGFIVAAALAARLDCGMVPVRKAGKLPPPTVHAAYALEYGTAEIEVPLGLLDGHRVLLVDDVLATGGTLRAAADLVERAGGVLRGTAVLLELEFLGGRARFAPREVDALLTLPQRPSGADSPAV